MSMLQNVTRGRQAPRIRGLWYGEPGIGKTSLAAQTEAPLIVSLDDGAGHLDVARIRVRSIAELRKLIAELTAQPGEFRTLVIDVIDEVERMIAVDIAENYRGDKGQRYATCAEIPFGVGNAAAIDRHWRPLLADLERMQQQAGLSVIFLAWAAEGRGGADDGANMAMWRPRLQDSPKVSACGLLYGWCDHVLFLAWERLAVGGDRDARDTREKSARQVGRAQRVIRTIADGPWMAKNRAQGMPPTIAMDRGPAATWALLRPFLLPEDTGAIRQRALAAVAALPADQQQQGLDLITRAGEDAARLTASEKWIAGRVAGSKEHTS